MQLWIKHACEKWQSDKNLYGEGVEWSQRRNEARNGMNPAISISISNSTFNASNHLIFRAPVWNIIIYFGWKGSCGNVSFNARQSKYEWMKNGRGVCHNIISYITLYQTHIEQVSYEKREKIEILQNERNDRMNEWR